MVLPVTLLIVAGLAGLLGEVTRPRWDGQLHRDPVAVGLALAVVLGVVLVITIRRMAARAHTRAVSAAPARAVARAAAAKLRRVLVFVLSTGMIAVTVIMLVGLHQHLFSGPAGARPGRALSAAPASPATSPGRHFFFIFHLHVTSAVLYGLLYGLLVVVFLGLGLLRVWWARRFPPSGPRRAYHYTAKDSQDLREAVESGRSALRAIDDARAAIIACYLAMETSLAEHGAARAIADTPDELLARATATGIVRGTAAARLTALFYEARFSSHPLDRGQRDAAAQALGELAADLAEAAAAGTQASRSRAHRSRARA